MKPAKQASFSWQNAVFMNFMCDIYQIWTILSPPRYHNQALVAHYIKGEACLYILSGQAN